MCLELGRRSADCARAVNDAVGGPLFHEHEMCALKLNYRKRNCFDFDFVLAISLYDTRKR